MFIFFSLSITQIGISGLASLAAVVTCLFITFDVNAQEIIIDQLYKPNIKIESTFLYPISDLDIWYKQVLINMPITDKMDGIGVGIF